MAQTHWKKLINPDYIGAYALDPGKDLTVQISQVRREMVTGADGKKEECTVAYLKDQKPMILNVTNCKTIEKLYGPYIEDWNGKYITLYAANVLDGHNLFGDFRFGLSGLCNAERFRFAHALISRNRFLYFC